MDIGIFELILLLIFVVITGYDAMNSQILMYGGTVIAGFITGLIFGDYKLGLEIGGTMQLMSLGIGPFGGASIPDYRIGAIIGTIVAVTSGEDLAYGLTVAVPVSLLMMQLDILVRTLTVWFAKKAESFVDTLETKKMYTYILSGWSLWIIKEVLPIILVLFAGVGLIQTLLEFIPDWIMGGMQVAGGLLPAVGIALLLKYMEPKTYIAYLILGFVLMSFFDMSMIGVGLIGLALALIAYKNENSISQIQVEVPVNQNLYSGKVGMDQDEL